MHAGDNDIDESAAGATTLFRDREHRLRAAVDVFDRELQPQQSSQP